jgi:hypothetical protein
LILVDTSVWRWSLRRAPPANADDAAAWEEARALPGLLEALRVLGHPWVYIELVLGGLPADAAVAYRRLRQCTPIRDEALVALVERIRPAGVGLVDVGLLGAAARDGARLWTLDRGLRARAREQGVEFTP